MLPVNTKMEPVAVEVVAIGSLNACLTEPREVFKHAVLNNAAGIVCFHNHPSRKAEPSRNDGLMTQRLVKAGGFWESPWLVISLWLEKNITVLNRMASWQQLR